MLVPLTPAERLDMQGLFAACGDVAVPHSVAEIEWHRKDRTYARRLARIMEEWMAHRRRFPAASGRVYHA